MTNPIIDRIQDSIVSIKPYDDLEKTHLDDALQWIQSTDKIFRIKKPDVPPKHLVSYFVLIDLARRSILLCDHIKAQLWLPSGGHVEPNEPPVDTVRREAIEELGIPAVFLHGNEEPFFITVTETVGLHPGHTDVSLWYLITGNSFDHIHFDRREFNDVEWWTFEEILETNPTIFDPHMQRFTRKLMQQLAAS